MKLRLAAVAALLALGAAQAVTLDWSAGDFSTGTKTFTNTYGANSSYSVCAALTVPALPGSGTSTLFTIGQEQNFPGGSYPNNNNSIRAELTSEGTLNLVAKGGSGSEQTIQVANGLTAGGEHKLAWTLQRGANTAQSTVTVYFDGEVISSGTVLDGGFWSGPANAAYIGADGVLSDLNVYTGILTEQQGTTWTVPEPTALALLALGVAGVALRRRVA